MNDVPNHCDSCSLRPWLTEDFLPDGTFVCMPCPMLDACHELDVIEFECEETRVLPKVVTE